MKGHHDNTFDHYTYNEFTYNVFKCDITYIFIYGYKLIIFN